MVNVKNEYGKLREVIVGRVDNANMPRHGFDLHAINYADKDNIPSKELGFFDPKVYEESIEDLDLLGFRESLLQFIPQEAQEFIHLRR